MIKGLGKLKEWIQFNNIVEYKVSRTKNGEVMFKDNCTGIEACQNSIERRMEICGNGDYYISGRPKDATGPNQWMYTPFSIYENGNNNIGSVPNIYQGGDLQSQIEKALNDYKKDEQIKDLQFENAELTKVTEGIGRVVSKIEPYLPILLNAVLKIVGLAGIEQPAVSGINNNNTNMSDVNERLKNAVNKWYNVDNDAIELIEKIADLAVNKNSIYQMAKKQLNDL